MRLPAKQRYALRIVVNIARRNGNRPAQKKEIAADEGIPADYVEQICVRLRAGGIIKSHRGKHGGFSLAREADKISVADVMSALDGHSALAPCLEGECRRQGICPTRSLWARANEAFEGVLSKATIAELSEEGEKLAESQTISFQI